MDIKLQEAFSVKVVSLSLILVFWLITTSAANAFSSNYPEQVTPLDSTVRKRILPNGLTLYIKKNKNPAGRIEGKLIVKAGRDQETDRQLEYAHLIEHLAFEGTANFPGDSLRKFISNYGLDLGMDVNAHTGDKYVSYDFGFPNGNPQLIEGILTFMSDCAIEIRWTEASIHSQAEAIISERGGDPSSSISTPGELTFVNDKILRNEKMSIGDHIARFNSLKAVDPKELKRYYQKYYRPENMAIIVVGDIDIAATERMLIRRFQGITHSATRLSFPRDQPRKLGTIPDSLYLHIDSAVFTPRFELYLYRKSTTDHTRSLNDFRIRVLDQLCASLINTRLLELAGGEEENRSAYIHPNWYSSMLDVLQFSALTPNIAQLNQSVYPMFFEVERIKRFGFNSNEVEQAKIVLQQEEKNVSGENSREGCEKLRDYFAYGAWAPSQLTEVALRDSLLRSFSLNNINHHVFNWIADDKNRSFAMFLSHQPPFSIPDRAEISKWIDSARSSELIPFVLPEPIGDSLHQFVRHRLPHQSELAFDSSWRISNTRMLELKNGFRAIIQIDSGVNSTPNEEMKIQGVDLNRKSPTSSDRQSISDVLIDDIHNVRTIPFTNSTLSRFLARESINISVSFQEGFKRLDASFDRSKLETVCALLTSYFLKPEAGSVNNFVFFVTGCRSMDSIAPLLYKYFGVLPKEGLQQSFQIDSNYYQDELFNQVPKDTFDSSRANVEIRVQGSKRGSFDLHGQVIRNVVENIFQELFFERLRTQEAATYAPIFSLKERRAGKDSVDYMFVGSFECERNRKTHLINISKQIFKEIENNGINPSVFKRSVIKTSKAFGTRYTPPFHVSQLFDFYRFGGDESDLLKVRSIIDQLSIIEVQEYVNSTFRQDRLMVFVSGDSPTK